MLMPWKLTPDRFVYLKMVLAIITPELQIEECKSALVKLVFVMLAPLSSAPPRSAFEKLMFDKSRYLRSNVTINAFRQSREEAQEGHEAAVVVGAIVVVVVVATTVVVVVGAIVVVVVDVVVVVEETVELVDALVELVVVVEVLPGGGATVSVVEVVLFTGDGLVGVTDNSGALGSRTTNHVTVMFCCKHLPVRGRFNTRVAMSTQAVALFPGVSRDTFIEPLRHFAPSANFMIRVLESTQSWGGLSAEDQVTLNSPRCAH